LQIDPSRYVALTFTCISSFSRHHCIFSYLKQHGFAAVAILIASGGISLNEINSHP
jgi:hypothetical protein